MGKQVEEFEEVDQETRIKLEQIFQEIIELNRMRYENEGNHEFEKAN